MEYSYEFVKLEDNLPIKIILHTTDDSQFIPRHWHDSVEISYVLAGRIDSIYVEGHSYTAEKGDIVLINSNAIHSFSVGQGKNRLALTILIPYELLKENCAEMDRCSFDCISLSEKNDDRQIQFNELRRILDAIVAAYMNKKDPLAHIQITALSYSLIYILLKNFVIDKYSVGSIKSEKHLERLTKLTNYIKHNYRGNLSIETLAAEFALTGEYLSRFFQKHMGMTILQYINAIRLEKSYRDLMNTDRSITHIAYDNGFPNEKSFNRVFKEIYKQTPHEYRKNQDLPVKKL